MIRGYLSLFMRSFFVYLSIFIFGICLFGISTFAADRCAGASAATDITCPGFKINLVNIDPVGNGNVITGGTDAATSLLAKIAEVLLFLIPII